MSVDDLAIANSNASMAIAERKRMAGWFLDHPDHPARSQTMWVLAQDEQRALDDFVHIKGQQRGANMAKATETPIQVFKNGEYQPIEGQPEPTHPRRKEIVTYIEHRLGPELATVYHDAIESSVSNGYYDAEWASGRMARIEHYVTVLRGDFMSKHAGQEALFVRVLAILEYGRDEDKSTLRKLLSIEQEGK